jgi:hypothetical protein
LLSNWWVGEGQQTTNCFGDLRDALYHRQPKTCGLVRAVSLSYQLYRNLLKKCRALPHADFYPFDDYVTNLLVTVLDLRLDTKIVEKALEHYRSKRAQEVRAFNDLKELVESDKSDSEIANYLWGL